MQSIEHFRRSEIGQLQLMTKIVGDDKGDNTVFPGGEMKSCSINFREVWEEAREERLGNSSPNRPNLLL